MSDESRNKRNSVITTIAILLLIGTGIYLSVLMGINSKLSDEIKNEKLTAESLLSQKLSLDKEISKTKADLKLSKAEVLDLERMLSETNAKLTAAEQGLKHSKNQSSVVAELKRQNNELTKQKEDLEQMIANQTNSLGKLQSSMDDLEDTISLLQKKNKDLTDELNVMRLTSINDLLIETTKKNNTLTIKAKRTKNLIVNLDVSSKAENLSFKIVSPSGKELTDKDGTFTINTILQNKERPQAFYVAELSSVPPPTYNRIQMSYLAKEKLSGGVYNIEVLSNSMSIGSLQVKLR